VSRQPLSQRTGEPRVTRQPRRTSIAGRRLARGDSRLVGDSRRDRVCDDPPMRPRIHAIALPSEIGDFADEVRQVFLELGRVFGPESLAGECSPPVDVYETDDAVEVRVDLPGTDVSTIRVMRKGDSI